MAIGTAATNAAGLHRFEVRMPKFRKSKTMSDWQVVIAGAGPVGLLTALGLAQKGVSCLIIDREPAVVRSPRACAYHWSTLPGLDRLGVLDKCLAAGGFKKNDFALRVYETGEKLEWTLDVIKGHVKFPFNLYMGQDVLADVLLAELATFENVEVRWNTTFVDVTQTDDLATISLQDEARGDYQITSEWLVGCDGAGSGVRKAIDADFEGFTWDIQFVATNFHADLESLGYAKSVLQVDKQYGAVLAKLDNKDLWRCAYSVPVTMNPDEIQLQMHEAFSKIMPDLGDNYVLTHFSPYRVHQRAAEKFRSGRVILAGDAAHATNPTGGLGLTTGMFDAFILYEALAAILDGTVRDNVLDQFASERKAVFLNYTSPQATWLKKLVFDCENLEEGLGRFRLMEKDPEARLKYSLFAYNLETPSLVTGQRDNHPVTA